mgnify:CR=1 FL=1
MTRRLRPGERIFGYAMFLFSLFLFYHAYQISGFSSISSAGAWPLAAAGLMALCSAAIIVQNHRMESACTGAREEIHQFGKDILPPHPLLGYLAIIVAYMLVLEPLGFNISSFLFLFGSFWYLHRRGIFLTLALSFGTVIATYVVFRVLFKVILPEAEWLDLSALGLGG